MSSAGKQQGFSGFFSQDFRIHDYLLGRQNCQQFLARHFVVPVGNTVVARWTQDPVLQSYLICDGTIDLLSDEQQAWLAKDG